MRKLIIMFSAVHDEEEMRAHVNNVMRAEGLVDGIAYDPFSGRVVVSATTPDKGDFVQKLRATKSMRFDIFELLPA